MAGPFISSFGALGYAKESTFGTPVAASVYVPFEECSLEKDPGLQDIQVARNQRELTGYLMPTEQKLSGKVSFPLFAQMGMGLVVGAIGYDSAVSGAGPYVHNIQQQNTLLSFTLEENLGGLESIQYAGAVVDKFSLKGTTKTAAMVSLDVIAQKDTQITTTTPSYTTDQPFVLAGTTISILGSGNANVESFELTIDNMAEPHYTYSGERYPTFIVSKGRKIELKYTVSLQDMTLYGDLPAANSSSSPTSGQEVLTLVSGTDQCVITIPQMAITKLSQPMKVGEVIMQDITMQAWIGSNANTMTASITSGRSTVY